MNKQEFEQFVMRDGKDILRFCRMNAGDTERGNELYQDTMLMLLEKRKKLNAEQNVKSYALYTAILLWKNKKKKYAVRNWILPMSSLEEHVEQGGQFRSGEVEKSPEQQVLNQAEIEEIQSVVAALPEKYKVPVYLNYSAGMKMQEIAECLHIPLSTVKTRMRKAKEILKEQLEAIGYDG